MAELRMMVTIAGGAPVRVGGSEQRGYNSARGTEALVLVA
jgi:hypothetical protein